MHLSEKIKLAIKPWMLLDHPFYQEWMKGSLKHNTLKSYSSQYYKHVEAFPRYISSTHSKCLNVEDRKVLLENLNEEEGFRGKPHPELWMNFAKAFGNIEVGVRAEEPCESVKGIIDTFMSSADRSFEEGIASFYTYESQVPEVAETKIKGLKEHYSVNSKEALEFFEVHKKADVYHRESCEKILDKIPEEKHEKSVGAAVKSAKALWGFLTEMHSLDKGVTH